MTSILNKKYYENNLNEIIIKLKNLNKYKISKPRKLTTNQEGPVDNLIYIIVENIDPYFYKLKFTPNMITTLSLICGIFSIYFLFFNLKKLAIFFYFLSYLFDCSDGYYARKYNMVTNFGDYYDHVKDLTIFSLLVYTLLNNNKFFFNNLICNTIIIFIFSLFMLGYFGCAEKIYDSSESESLSGTKKLCPNKNYIYFYRYFSSGSMLLVLFIYIILK